MYQTYQQRSLDWQRAICPLNPDKHQHHRPADEHNRLSPLHPTRCIYCDQKITMEGQYETNDPRNATMTQIFHWKAPKQITLREWP